MTSSQKISAKKGFESLKDVFRLKRIYIVDDDYEEECFSKVTIKNALKELSELNSETAPSDLVKAIEGVQEKGFAIEIVNMDGQINPFDEIEQDIDLLWEDIDDEQKCQLWSALELNDTRGNTSEAFSSLATEEASGFVVFLSVSDWAKQKERIIEEQATELAIVLFDLSLQHADLSLWGNISYRTAGRVLAKEILDLQGTGLIPGILTGEADSEQDEARLSGEQFNEGLFAGVMGKFRFRHKEKDITKGINGILISHAKFRTNHIATKAFSAAAKPKELLSGFTNLHVLSRLSVDARKEGVNIIDLIMRILSDACSEQAQHRARVEYLIDPFLPVYTANEERFQDNALFKQTIDDELQELKVSECYIDGARLLEGRFPTALGDIYEITSHCSKETEWYVLLQQPCNLAVRPDGVRNPDNSAAVLVRLSNVSKRNNHYSKQVFPLPMNKDQSSKGSYRLDYSHPVLVPFDYLDLCVFSNEGCSSVGLEQEFVQNLFLEPGWQKRSKTILENIKNRLNRWESLFRFVEKMQQDDEDENIGKKLNYAISAAVFGIPAEFCDVFVAKSEVRFGIRRVGRFRAVYATGMLSEMADYRSRAAYPGVL